MRRVARTWMLSGLSAARGDAGPANAAARLRLTPSGGIRMLEGDAAVRQAIIVLLSTLPGERVMRPDYGCPLDRLLFSPNDATTAGLAIHYIQAALGRWEPRIEILRLDAGAGAGSGPAAGGRLEVSLEYRIRASSVVDRLGFTIDLDGGSH